ncbi:hypothetical protein NUH30_18825 [Leptospira sp. 85282-16]|uniref:hypothetical protein n=1 Tax=Leptospira sp. 85282-16 TaxID=2971256 RepID=UPI0021C23F47|nr:hypothetical protein [Leptospira sp. 85282-16]MCT8335747.1 hypothetical protein [Leptospira sp. 85282-16]
MTRKQNPISYIDYLVDSRYSNEDFFKAFHAEALFGKDRKALSNQSISELIEIAEVSGSQEKIKFLFNIYPELNLI